MNEAHRATLLRLAAERGEKGFSRLVEEAIEAYLANLGVDPRRSDARRLRGVLGESDANELATRVEAIRRTWR